MPRSEHNQWILRQGILAIGVLLPGIIITVVSSYYLVTDWAALIRAFHQFEATVGRHEGFTSIYVADSYQRTYRINCFAEGVGVIGGLTISSIGIVGLCLNRQPPLLRT